MRSRHWTSFVLRGCTAALGLSLLAGCSSSFGGGSEPSRPNTIVVPQGTAVVCQNGTAPPCTY
jgi:hypothetical protein